MTFKNEAQLKKFLMEKCAKAVANTERKVHEEFAGNLNQFYTEFTPEEYIRTGALFNSLESTGVKRTGNQHMSRVEAEVYFNTPHYEQGVMPLQHTLEHGMYGWASATGEEVLDMALTGRKPHGGYAGGTAIWTESMKKLGGKRGINKLLKQELKKQGL
jgi:hypothetical protein